MAHHPSELLGFQQEVVRLQALLEASRRIHSTLRLDEILHLVLEIAVKEIEAEGACYLPAAGHNEPRPITYGNFPLDPDRSDSCHAFPLADKSGEALATLFISTPGRTLSLEEADFLEGLALQAGVAVETARQHQQLLAWERVQQDLSSAREIQRSLLPQDVPRIPGYSVSYLSDACYEVGGDYVDILPMKDGRYMLLVADVAGKGLASAMVSVSFRSAFRAMSAAGLGLAELTARMNDLHFDEGLEARRRYVTAILVCLDTVNNTVEYVNAGHCPGFLMESAGHLTELSSSGTPLGMLRGMTYTAAVHAIPPGGKLMLYTDGLVEVFRGEEEFGAERLLEEFAQCGGRESEALLQSVWGRLIEFRDNAPQCDDMTALALIRTGPEGGSRS